MFKSSNILNSNAIEQASNKLIDEVYRIKNENK